MATYLGILSDSYRRQLRKVAERPKIDVVLDKVDALTKEFGIRPLGLDFGVGQLASKDRGYLDELKARFEQSHILPTVMIGSLMLHADEDIYGPPLRNTLQNLEIAHYLESPLGVFFFGYGGRVTRQGLIRLAVEQVRQVAEAAQALGLTIVTEDYDRFTSDEFVEIFRDVGMNNVGLNNDVGNWLLLGEDPLEATRKMAPYTYHAHVRDYVLRDGVYTSVPVGKGLVDFPAILAELEKVGDQRERLVLAIEMDLDEGDEKAEDAAVRECARYMARWYRDRKAA